jgi:hypothetical protein
MDKYLTDMLVNKVQFRVWNKDEIAFYCGNVIFVLYTDDSILAGKDLGETDKSTTKLGYQVAIPYWNTEMNCGDGA